MNILYVSPRPFGLMATPGTYLTIEAYSQFAETIAITGLKKPEDVIVRDAKDSLHLKEINYDANNWLGLIIYEISKSDPDLICIANWPKAVDLVNEIASVYPDKKVILELKSPLLFDGEKMQEKKKIYDLISDKLSGVIALSEPLAKTWFSKINFPIQTHPLMVDYDLIQKKSQFSDLSSEVKFIFTGSMTNRRKIDKLIQCIANLPQDILQRSIFDFYGDGQKKDKLIALTKELGLSQKIQFHGAVDQNHLFSLYKEYDIGIAWVPKELYDCAPSLKLLEYCAAGLVPLATNNSGHSSFSDYGYNVHYFDHDPVSFSNSVSEIVNNKVDIGLYEKNVSQAKKSDYLEVVNNIILPFYEEQSSNHRHQNITIDRKFKDANKRNLNWIPESIPFVSKREQNNNLSVAAILSERLYYGLDPEVDLTILPENNFTDEFFDKDFDFLLVESVLKTVVDDWQYMLTDGNQDKFTSLLSIAKNRGVKTAFWVTVDQDDLGTYAGLFEYFDFVFFADHKAYEAYKDESNKFKFLPPAIQPRLFNPLKPLVSSVHTDNKVLINGINSILSSVDVSNVVENNKNIKFIAFEQSHIPTRNNRRRNNKLFPDVDFKGKVPHRLLPEVYKNYSSIITSSVDRLSTTEKHWRSLESAACKCVTVNLSSENINKYISFESACDIRNNDAAIVETSPKAMNKSFGFITDQFSIGALSLKLWRHVYKDNLFEHRVSTICNSLGLLNVSDKEFKVSVVSPTVRADNLDRILENFYNQTYKNKELIIVVNSTYDAYCEVKNSITDKQIVILHVPQNHYAATAMNFAAKHCSGDYFFRFDDDDYYGENYLLDSMLMLKSDKADIQGKFSAFVQYTNEQNVYLRKTADLVHESCHRSFTAKEIGQSYSNFSGATFGVKLSLINKFPFPDSSLAAADSVYLDLLSIHCPNVSVMKTDWFNFTIGREQDSSTHTWQIQKDDLVNAYMTVTPENDEVPRNDYK